MKCIGLSVAMIGVTGFTCLGSTVSRPAELWGGVLAGRVLSSAPAFSQEKPGAPMKVAAEVMAANVVEKPEPVCSPEHKGDKLTGTVVLDAIIGVDGKVENLNVISGPEALRGCVLDAVSEWTYKPYLLNGVATAVETTITVKLDSGGM
jgi:periplasmic protein TonB